MYVVRFLFFVCLAFFPSISWGMEKVAIPNWLSTGPYQNQTDCPICFIEFNDFVTGMYQKFGTCGHWTCNKCVTTYCALCRKPMPIFAYQQPTEEEIKSWILALQQDDRELVNRYLMQGWDVNVYYQDKLTALHAVIRKKNEPMVNQLLADGADIEALYSDSFFGSITPLMLAISSEANTIVSLLIERSAQIDVASKIQNMTPLHIAIWCRNYKAAEILLQHGALVDVVDRKGSTPFSTIIDIIATRLLIHKCIKDDDLEHWLALMRLLIIHGSHYRTKRLESIPDLALRQRLMDSLEKYRWETSQHN